MIKRNIYFLLAWIMITTVVFAQGRGRGQGPRYDASAEATFSGTVQEIKTLDAMCHSSTHIILKTEQGNTEVALGPSKFLADQKLQLSKNDQVQVVGAKVNTRRGEMFVARQITAGGKELTLRNGNGVPVWPRSMCR